jgi:hypothetical protein
LTVRIVFLSHWSARAEEGMTPNPMTPAIAAILITLKALLVLITLTPS